MFDLRLGRPPSSCLPNLGRGHQGSQPLYKQNKGDREWLMHTCMLSHFSCVRHCANPMDCSPQAPLSMGFSRQEYWSGLPCPSPGALPNQGMGPRSSALQADSLLSELPGKLRTVPRHCQMPLGREGARLPWVGNHGLSVESHAQCSVYTQCWERENGEVYDFRVLWH